jgi:2-iminobutanoate/2-iminopropanoate deaminase
MKRPIWTDRALELEGRHAQAVDAGGLVFTAMQLPLDPASGKIISGDTALWAHQALSNAQAVLEAAGCRLADVVQVTVYVTDLQEMDDVNAVYGRYFRTNPPTRSVVEAVALPRGAQVAVSAVALAADEAPNQES